MSFNFKAPDYTPVFRERMGRLAWLRDPEKGAERVAALRAYYKDHPAQFIEDWGCTFDPRNVEVGLPASVPFLLFDKQKEFIERVMWKWQHREPLIAEKSREVGMSWIVVSLGATLCLHHKGIVVGYGSRKEEYVDGTDKPKSLFWKAREFLKSLPPEFTPDWEPRRHATHMKITFPATGSYMAGEAGDSIGRGDRASIYFVDESAFLERPLLVDASLSQTTNCRIDISSANGTANPFYAKRSGGNIEVFTLHWRDDPRKDEAWYEKQKRDIDNPVIVAQELDINYNASVEGVVIPSEHVQAAIDAHVKLRIKPTGARRGAFDVADQGKDKLAFVVAHGIVVTFAKEWSGIGSDTFKNTQHAFQLADENEVREFRYDGDGLGAHVRGDARVINESRAAGAQITVTMFRGSAGVFRPEAEDVKGRKNEDYFANYKAQSWNALAKRFRLTFRAVEMHAAGEDWRAVYSPDDLISLDSASLKALGVLSKITSELSQPTWSPNTAGKMVVDKTPDDTKSPNLGDGVMMLFSDYRTALNISDEALRGL